MTDHDVEAAPPLPRQRQAATVPPGEIWAAFLWAALADVETPICVSIVADVVYLGFTQAVLFNDETRIRVSTSLGGVVYLLI